MNLLGAALSWASVATAAPVDPPRAVLDIVLFGDRRACKALQTEVASLLSRDAAVIWAHHDGGPGPLDHDARAALGRSQIWIDASVTGVVRIFTVPRGREPSLRLIDAPEIDEVSAEIVGQIVRASAVSLLDEARAANDVDVEETAPESPPIEAEAPPAKKHLELLPMEDDDALESAKRADRGHRASYEFAAAYVTRSDAPASGGGAMDFTAWQGGQLSMAVLFSREPVRPFAAFSVDLMTAKDPFLYNDAQRCATRASIGVEWGPVEWTRLRLAIGAGFDYQAVIWASRLAPGGRVQIGVVFPMPVNGLEIIGGLTLDYVAKFIDISQTHLVAGAMLGVGYRL